MTIYLGVLLPTPSCDSSLDYSRDTILHAGKDLAVSLKHFAMQNVRATKTLFWFNTHITVAIFHKMEFLPFRFERHCSHLADYSGRALPATFPTLQLPAAGKIGTCSDFPHTSITLGTRSPGTNTYYTTLLITWRIFLDTILLIC